MTISADEAHNALADLRASKQRLALAADCPPIRHLAFALVIGALVSLPAFPVRTILFLELGLLVAIALIAWWDLRRTGMFINGYRMGATRPITFAMLAVMLGMTLVGVIGISNGLAWAPIAAGLISVVLAYGFSVRWQKIFRRELGLVA